MYVVNNSPICVSLLIRKLLWDQEDKKRPEKYAVPNILSLISKLTQECFPKDEQNVLKRNMLVAYHTDLVLIINVEINIIRPDLNDIYQYCVVFIYILVYTSYNTLHTHTMLDIT